MRILEFVADAAPGGGTTHVEQLLRGLKHEHELALLTQRGSVLYERGVAAGIRTFGGDFFRGRLNLKSVLAVRDALREFRPDLVHCHGGRAAFFRSLVSDRCSTVYTAHGLHYRCKTNHVMRILGLLGERWACRKIDQAIFVSEHDASAARADRLLPPSVGSTVIYPAIADHNIARTPHGFSKPLIGFVGRLVPQKNPQLFLDVIEQLPEVQAVLGGGGPLQAELQQRCVTPGLAGRVEVLGEMSHAEVLLTLSRLDVLVMTSRWEGLPALLLEGMRLGVPVVTTAVGGIPEIVDHGKTGWLARNGESSEFASLVRHILQEPVERERVIAAAKDQVAPRFLETTMVAATERLYRSVAQQTVSPPSPAQLQPLRN